MSNIPSELQKFVEKHQLYEREIAIQKKEIESLRKKIFEESENKKKF
jgi:hypothetical protein